MCYFQESNNWIKRFTVYNLGHCHTHVHSHLPAQSLKMLQKNKRDLQQPRKISQVGTWKTGETKTLHNSSQWFHCLKKNKRQKTESFECWANDGQHDYAIEVKNMLHYNTKIKINQKSIVFIIDQLATEHHL